MLKRCRLGYLKRGNNQNFEEELSKLKMCGYISKSEKEKYLHLKFGYWC